MSYTCRQCTWRVAVVCAVLVVGFSVSPASAVTATFSLQTAGGQSTVIDINDVLDLEIYVTLDTAADIAGYSYDLETSADGIINFMSASLTSPWTGMFGLQVNGTDNVANDDVTPLSGSFGRTVVANPLSPEPFPAAPTLLASFSVVALAAGEVSYSFDPGAGLRDWQMGLASGGEAALAASSPALTITVQPEPTSAAMMLITAAWWVRRRRRAGSR